MKFVVNIFDKYFVNVKINGNGFNSRSRNIGLVSLLKNLKKAWPDHSLVPNVESFGFTKNIAPILRGFKPKILKSERILNIGDFKNEMVETLKSNGFCNTAGIDINSFRDLKLNKKYDAIYFIQVLKHSPGGYSSEGDKPSLQLFADKIYLHLRPKGYLIFSDFADNVPEFKECLLNRGFKQLPKHKNNEYIFQKP